MGLASLGDDVKGKGHPLIKHSGTLQPTVELAIHPSILRMVPQHSRRGEGKVFKARFANGNVTLLGLSPACAAVLCLLPGIKIANMLLVSHCPPVCV